MQEEDTAVSCMSATNLQGVIENNLYATEKEVFKISIYKRKFTEQPTNH